MVERVAVARAVIRQVAAAALVAAAVVLGCGVRAEAQAAPPCRVLCEPELKVEPTFTIENLASRHRIVLPDGTTRRVDREGVFEAVLALDLATRIPRLGVTAEMIVQPFSDDNEAELEFEANLHWLTEPMTRGWVTSHFDIVDQFSPAERPDAGRPYTHKLDFELDTALHLFNWLPEDRWLRGVEFETSLDYLATGLPTAGDRLRDELFLDDASPWSLSFVIVIPIAPF